MFIYNTIITIYNTQSACYFMYFVNSVDERRFFVSKFLCNITLQRVNYNTVQQFR